RSGDHWPLPTLIGSSLMTPVHLRKRRRLGPSAAAHVVVAAAFDRASRDRAADRAEHGAERLRIARCDDVASGAAGDGADDKPGRAVVAAAIIFAVAPAIDAVVVRQAAFAVTAVVGVIIIGIIAAVARVGPVIVVTAILVVIAAVV